MIILAYIIVAYALIGLLSMFFFIFFEEANNKLILELKWFLKRILKKYPTDLY